MSRIAPPSEKIMATAGIFKALIDELGLVPPVPVHNPPPGLTLGNAEPPTIEWLIPPPVMASLIDASVRIALATDTRDMGILVAAPPPGPGPGTIVTDSVDD